VAGTKDRSINGLFEALSRNGIEVISLRNKQSRLEQLFLDMVENGGDSEDMPA
jgi:ABC-2 type transport system ATP-binding protein